MTYLFAAATPPSVAIRGSADRFAVRRIFCVGRNYAAHAAEMGGDAREPPFYFTKPADAICQAPATVPYPSMTSNYHYEMELVIAVGKRAFRVAKADAVAHIFGFACGLDMTRRDLQLKAKEKGHPWDMGKAFDRSAVIADIVPRETLAATAQEAMSKGAISLSVNGQVKQSADVAQMIWGVPEIIADLSQYVELAAGDLIYTGTPAGVGPVVSGDRIAGRIDGLGEIALTIGDAEA